MLYQVGEDKVIEPIIFMGRKFTDAALSLTSVTHIMHPPLHNALTHRLSSHETSLITHFTHLTFTFPCSHTMFTSTDIV